MKKLIAILLMLAMLAALCACGEEKPAPEAAPEAAPAVEAEETAETEEAPEVAGETEEPSGAEETPAEPEVTEEPVEEETPEEPQIAGVVGETGYWYDLLSGSGEYTDLSGNVNQYTYAIPAFNHDSADASRLNDEIMTFCQAYVDEMADAEANGYSLTTLSVSYEASLNGEIASILISVVTDIGYNEYHAYNLNVATGAEATGTDLIAQAGLSEDEFVAAAQNAASEHFKSQYAGMEGESFYQDLYDKTMSADIFSLHMPMYIDASGTLKVVAPIYSAAGAEFYYEVLTVA